MALGLIGRKCGMTRVFSEDGQSHPVTVVEVRSNYVTQLKTPETDGYYAVQLTEGKRKKHRVTKPEAGHFAKAGVEAGTGLWEFRLDGAGLLEGENAVKVGAELKADLFQSGQFVDVSGVSKGKGFAGVIKRHNFKSQDATHGNSLSHRAPGSIGQNQSPGRVFKGKKMAGQLGNKKTTVQNLKIVKVDVERNLLLIEGAVPGMPGGLVMVKPAVKKSAPEQQG